MFLVYAWRAVSKLRNSSATYKARLLPFAYFSFSSWIVCALQSAILLPAPLISFPQGSFLNNAGLWLGLMQNALWASAVLSLYPKQLALKLSLPVLLISLPVLSVIATIVVALVASPTTVLSSVTVAFIDFAFTFLVFTGFVLWILKWRLSGIFVGLFFIHGCYQTIWRSLWFTPLAGTQIATLFAFPVWRVLLLIAWISLISIMRERAEASVQQAGTVIKQLEFPNPLDPFNVMIGSTRADLEQERDAAEGAILALPHLDRYRAEKLGSVSGSPREICELMAKQCDIFLLIIGERYGHIIEPEGISVVEFEYDVARDDYPRKILVYVKDSRRDDENLLKFLDRVQKFNDGYIIWSFSTPEELAEQIPFDIMRWLISHAKQNKAKSSVVRSEPTRS
jgi:hypothetical protein